MDASHAKSGSLSDSLRRAGNSLLGLMQARMELFVVELQEEKLRALGLFVWVGLALTLGAAGLLAGLGALAIYLWSIAGYLGLLGLALAALVGAAAVLWTIRNQIRNGPLAFAETIAEFRKDRQCLDREH